jgi:hypothetical protein
MRRIAQKAWLSVSLSIFLLPITSVSQDVTGIWRGYFITDQGDYYRLEFQVKQNPTAAVSGVSYSYLDVRFYGKATMTGAFLKGSGNFRIKEIKTVEVKSSTGGGTCIMNYDLVYSKSGNEEFLEGTYLGRTEVTTGKNPYEWGQCGRGKVFLRKVVSSDFYIEPFLRKTVPNTTPNRSDTSLVTPPPVVRKTPTTTSPNTSKPGTTRSTVAKRPVTTPKSNITKTNTKVNRPVTEIQVKPNTDSIVKKINEPSVKMPEKPVVITPAVLTQRSNELMKSLTVNNPNVTVRLYDNGEIDDDTISIYYDKKLLMANKRLSASPITIHLKLDEEDVPHELVMVAENLGRIPPNTSLMIVDAGDQRFEVRITSNEQKNALVRFKYQRPN